MHEINELGADSASVIDLLTTVGFLNYLTPAIALAAVLRKTSAVVKM
jgi:hypothetical protein